MLVLSHYAEEQREVKGAQRTAHVSKMTVELAAAHQQFKNAHNFIYVFKSIKSDVVTGYYKYKH